MNLRLKKFNPRLSLLAMLLTRCTYTLSLFNTLGARLAGLAAPPEEVRQGLNYALRHALACTINCVLLAITHAYKCSWQLKPRFSRYFAGGSEGLSRSKGLLFEGKNHGPKDRAELQEYIGEPLARNTVDAFNDGRKYRLLIYSSY